MSSLIELTSRIVASHSAKSVMTPEQLLQEMHQVHEVLKMLEEGKLPEPVAEQPTAATLTSRQAFKKDEVICMVCNKGGFKTLTRHLVTAHNLKPGQYRKQFGIKSTQKLSAKSVTEARRKMAADRGMGDILAKARETRMANIQAKKNALAVKAKAATPVVKKKAPVTVAKLNSKL